MKKSRQTVLLHYCVCVGVCVCMCLCKSSEKMKGKRMWNVEDKRGFICG